MAMVLSDKVTKKSSCQVVKFFARKKVAGGGAQSTQAFTKM